MIVEKHERVLVQGITGKQGSFWTERMQAYGTNIMGGVNPRRAGETACGVPVFASAVAAAQNDGFDVSAMFIPPMLAKDAALDAIEAGAKGIVCLTEHIPVQDVMYFLAAAREAGTWVIGPNTTGVVTAGQCFVGFMPVFEERVFQPGDIGIVSRSGSLGTLVCMKMVEAGFGTSTFIGIGGDPIIGSTTLDALITLDADDRTKGIVLIGEIGGEMEEEAAEYAKGMDKPIVAFIAGAASPPGKRMGHAGAIVMGSRGTYQSKRKALEAAGVVVLVTPAVVGEAMREAMG